MAEWTTVASLATAGGTMALAIATFVAVRSANRASRVAEYSMQIGIRPLLMPSRLEDVPQKIMWGDEHWARLEGSAATAEQIGEVIYLAMSLRNAGSGTAVLLGWHLGPQELTPEQVRTDLDEFRPQLRDLYVPGRDVGFWQAAFRDPADPEYRDLADTVQSRRVFTIDLLYSDHEGGQRAIGRFTLAPRGDDAWMCSVVRHWNVDRPDPR
jgi:hypothetical protein